jgi:hypothetical protein
VQALGKLKAEAKTKAPGVHDPLEPEFSILTQRLARHLAYVKMSPANMTLVDITKAAERVITTVRLCRVVA